MQPNAQKNPQPPQPRIKRAVVNTFGTLGYLSLILQWVWVAVAYGPFFLDSALGSFLIPSPSAEPPPEVESAGYEPSGFVFVIGIIITVFVLGLSIYVLTKIPRAIGKTGQKITQSTARAAVPLVTRHHAVTPQKKQRITARIVAVLKLLLVIVPLLAILPARLLEDLQLDYDILLIISAIGALISAVCFGIQYALAALLRVTAKSLW